MANSTPISAQQSAQQARTQHRQDSQQRAFDLNDKQYDFVYDDANKFSAFIGGIGSGKSFAGAVKALRMVIEHPGSLGVIGAPNYPQLRDSTERMVFDVFPSALIRSFNKTEGLLMLQNGSEILFRSMDKPDSLRGPNLGWFWLDEGPLCGYYAWQVMKGRLRQAGYACTAWITGTPKGEDEFYEDFVLYPKPDHRLYNASTRENAHNLPQRFIEDLGYDGQFALQEIEGQFVRFEGAVYDFRREWHIGDWADKHTDGTRHFTSLRIGGIDWGFTNPSVALPMFVDLDDRVYVLDEYYQRQTGYAGVAQAAVDFTRKYGVTRWYCGPDEPEHIQDLNALFAKEGLAASAIAADDDISPGLTTVRRYMKMRDDGRTGYQISPQCVQTMVEKRTYSYPRRKPGADRDPQEKPIKAFDHAMDAERYAIHSALGTLGYRGMPGDVDPSVFGHLGGFDDYLKSVGGHATGRLNRL